MSAHLRLITVDGRPLCGTRTAARLASQPNAALARAVHDLAILRREAEAVAGDATHLQEVVQSFRKAIQAGDPIVIWAMARATDEMASMVHARAMNLGHMIERCTPGGAA